MCQKSDITEWQKGVNVFDFSKGLLVKVAKFVSIWSCGFINWLTYQNVNNSYQNFEWNNVVPVIHQALVFQEASNKVLTDSGRRSFQASE